jgi:hypothetical protein
MIPGKTYSFVSNFSIIFMVLALRKHIYDDSSYLMI